MINNPHLNERASKEQSFIFNTFSEVINARRDCIAKGVTFISSGKRSYLSYAQIYAKAVHAAAYLTESGFKKGDWLIFQIERKSDFVPILWACLLTGVIALPVTFSIKKDGSEFLRKIIKLSDNVRLVTTKDYWDFLEQNGSTDGLGVPVLVEEIEEYSGKPFDGNINITPDDLAFIQFSSGSTNSPKGVKISHRNLMCSCRMMHRGVQMNAEDIVSVWLPLTYDMGLIGGHLLFVFSCCDEVLLDVADFMTDPLAWLRTISDYKVTITIAPNSSYHMMCQKYKAEKAIGVDFNFDFSNWRSAVCGGERVTEDTFLNFESSFRCFGVRKNVFFPVYGMAETTLGISFPEPQDDIGVSYIERRSLTAGEPICYYDNDNENASSYIDSGYPLHECKIAICDDNGVDLGEDRLGTISVYGDCVGVGYITEAGDIPLRGEDGWYRTSDFGFLRNGRVTVVGRMDDWVIINGRNYCLADLEETARSIVSNTDESIAAASIRSDSDETDRVAMFIHSHKPECEHELLVQRVQERLFECFELVVPVVIVEDIPKTAGGKVNRRELGRQYVEQYSQIASGKKKDIGDAVDNGNTHIDELSDVWERLYGFKVDPDESLFSQGIDSGAALLFTKELSKRINQPVDISDLYFCKTIRGIVDKYYS